MKKGQTRRCTDWLNKRSADQPVVVRQASSLMASKPKPSPASSRFLSVRIIGSTSGRSSTEYGGHTYMHKYIHMCPHAHTRIQRVRVGRARERDSTVRYGIKSYRIIRQHAGADVTINNHNDRPHHTLRQGRTRTLGGGRISGRCRGPREALFAGLSVPVPSWRVPPPILAAHR